MTIRAIIFDMDGTLTESYINWPELRSKINCPPEKTIIEHIDKFAGKNNANRPMTSFSKKNGKQRNTPPFALVQQNSSTNYEHASTNSALVTNNHGAAMHRRNQPTQPRL